MMNDGSSESKSLKKHEKASRAAFTPCLEILYAAS